VKPHFKIYIVAKQHKLNERCKEIEAKTIEFRITGVSIKDLRDKVDKRKKNGGEAREKTDVR
jgi:hypothetical protein